MRPLLQANAVCDVLAGLALLELARARFLAEQLPGTTDFEEHARIGLEIGRCGRRIELLLHSRSFSEDYSWQFNYPSFEALGCDYIDSPESAYGTLLRSVEDDDFGMHDLNLALKQCIRVFNGGAQDDQLVDKEKLLGDLRRCGESGFSHGPQKPRRVCRGPAEKKHDDRWRFAEAKELLPRMPRIESTRGLAQKLHHTAFRETVASEIVSLNLLEYADMPWAFYLDMMRQCEDESRHSLMAADLFLKRGGTFNDFLLPYMKSYYEMFWDMNLTERLVALNVDIEAVGAPHLQNIAERLHTIGDTDAAYLFACLNFDERRHARIGAVWLKHLYPSATQRRAALDACRAFTSINLANTSARLTGEDFLGTIDDWAAGHPIYQYDEPMGPQHEREVTPLLARVKGNFSDNVASVFD